MRLRTWCPRFSSKARRQHGTLLKPLISNRIGRGTFAARADMLVSWRGIQPSRDVAIVHAHAPLAPTFGFLTSPDGGLVSGRTLSGLSPAARSRTRTAAGDPALRREAILCPAQLPPQGPRNRRWKSS